MIDVHTASVQDEENSQSKFVNEIDWAYRNSVWMMHYGTNSVTNASTSQLDIICYLLFTFWDQFNKFPIVGSS